MQYPSAAPKNRALVVLGAQWGDEGKVIEFSCAQFWLPFLQNLTWILFAQGKIVDVLSKDVDIVARCQGGSNAGHTIKVFIIRTGRIGRFYLDVTKFVAGRIKCLQVSPSAVRARLRAHNLRNRQRCCSPSAVILQRNRRHGEPAGRRRASQSRR